MNIKSLILFVTASASVAMLSGCGATQNVQRGEGNTSQQVSDKAQNVSQQIPVIVDSGYTIQSNSIGVYGTYVAEVKNPNTSDVPLLASIDVTVKNKDGVVLSNTQDYLPQITPGETIPVCNNYVDCKGDTEAIIELTVSGSNFIPESSATLTNASQYKVDNVNEVGSKSDYSSAITGQVTNNSNIDATQITVIVEYYKDNKLVGGDIGYVNNLPVGATGAFEINTSFRIVPDYNSYTVKAYRIA